MLSESPGGSEHEEQSGKTSGSGPVDPRLALLGEAQARGSVATTAVPSATVQLRTVDEAGSPADDDQEAGSAGSGGDAQDGPVSAEDAPDGDSRDGDPLGGATSDDGIGVDIRPESAASERGAEGGVSKGASGGGAERREGAVSDKGPGRSEPDRKFNKSDKNPHDNDLVADSDEGSGEAAGAAVKTGTGPVPESAGRAEEEREAGGKAGPEAGGEAGGKAEPEERSQSEAGAEGEERPEAASEDPSRDDPRDEPQEESQDGVPAGTRPVADPRMSVARGAADKPRDSPVKRSGSRGPGTSADAGSPVHGAAAPESGTPAGTAGGAAVGGAVAAGGDGVGVDGRPGTAITLDKPGKARRTGKGGGEAGQAGKAGAADSGDPAGSVAGAGLADRIGSADETAGADGVGEAGQGGTAPADAPADAVPGPDTRPSSGPATVLAAPLSKAPAAPVAPAAPPSAPAAGPGPAPTVGVPAPAVPVAPVPVAPAAPAASVPAPAPAAPASAAPAPPPAPAGAAQPGAPLPPDPTKQQPLPPEPADPLKLLADLTNTPPPPDTPLRTAARRVKIWTPLVLILLIALGVAQMLRPLPEPVLDLSAPASHSFTGSGPEMPWPSEGQAAITVEGLGTFGSAGGDKPRPIASVTKVMTAYVILQGHPLKKGGNGPVIEIDQEAQDHYERGLPENESVVKVLAGQKITEYAALQDLLITSANNVARLLARWDAGSEKAFAEKMNKAAGKLGMTNTTYTDPSGLDSTTVSTARDQVILGQAAMGDPVFREIVNTGAYRPANYTSDVYNHNTLLHKDGVVGLKTGNSTAAGANLLFASEKEVDGTRQLIVGAVLGQRGAQPAEAAASASRELIVAARDALTSTRLIKKGQVVGQVDDGLGTTTPVVATKDVVAVGWAGLTVKLDLKPGDDGLPRKAARGETVGTLTVGDGPGQVKVPVTLEAAVDEPSVGARLLRIL